MPRDFYGKMIKDDLAELRRDLASERDLWTCFHWFEFHAGQSRYHAGALIMYLQKAEELIGKGGPQDLLAKIRDTAASLQKLLQALAEAKGFCEQWSESQTYLIAAKADEGRSSP